MSAVYYWRTNLRAPFDRTDSAWLAEIASYKVGAPQVATYRESALPKGALQDFNIVGIYAPDGAMPSDRMGAFERAPKGPGYEPLCGHLAKYLDENQHLRPPSMAQRKTPDITGAADAI